MVNSRPPHWSGGQELTIWCQMMAILKVCFFGTPCMNMRGESERHFEPISYLIEAQLCFKSGSLEISESVEIYVWSGRDCVRGNLLLQAPNRLPACRRERLKFVWWGKWRLEKDAKRSSEKACFCQDEKMFSYKLADFDLTLIVGLSTVYWSVLCITYWAVGISEAKKSRSQANTVIKVSSRLNDHCSHMSHLCIYCNKMEWCEDKDDMCLLLASSKKDAC